MILRKIPCFLLLFGFLLGIHQGKIALWKEDDPQPIQIFPYSASLLPPQDQAALEKGILIRDQAHLISLLEAYLS